MSGRWRLRSLRMRAFLVAFAVAVLPLVMVAGASVIESGVGERLQVEVEGAAAELARDPDDIEGVALRWGVRARVVEIDGRVRAMADHHDTGTQTALGDVFFGPDGAPTLVEYDETLGPVGDRIESTRAFAGQRAVGCAASVGGRLLECHATVPIEHEGRVIAVAHTQDGSRRAIRALYDLRYQLIKLTLITVPCAVALGWWLGWRMVRPIERLRAQAIEQVGRLSRGDPLELARRDEFGDLASALNHLILEVREHAAAHEAALADLAHELKNPVAAIRASAEALADRPDDADRTRKLAAVVGDASARLDRLVLQFLELARAEAGLRGEVREPIDVAVLARAVVDTTAADPRHAAQTFALEVDGGLSTTVEGVSDRVETAIRNLVDNAASHAKARVVVRITRGERVRIEVSDDGPGIAAERLSRVFDRFESKRPGGTGLGLALVRAIAEAHGGRAWAESDGSTGSRFVMELAAARC